MNVHFFVNTSSNRANQWMETKSILEFEFLFVRIVTHSRISRREKMKIFKNVNDGGPVPIINGNVKVENVLTRHGSMILNGTVQMPRTCPRRLQRSMKQYFKKHLFTISPIDLIFFQVIVINPIHSFVFYLKQLNKDSIVSIKVK